MADKLQNSLLLSLGNNEDPLRDIGVDVSRETNRHTWGHIISYNAPSGNLVNSKQTDWWLKNWPVNSQLSAPRRERVVQGFWHLQCLEKIVPFNAYVYDHFDQKKCSQLETH